METLLFSVNNNIATITFNRPNAMNAFNKTMADELITLTEQVRQDDSIRALLLNGTGPLFMAGGDLHFFYQGLDHMPKGVAAMVGAVNQSILNFTHMPKPIVASVHGSIAGVGMS